MGIRQGAVYVGPEDGRPGVDPIGYPQREIVTRQDTAGAYCVHAMTKPPGEGPPPHVHETQEEAFFVLDGEFTFKVGDEEVVATAGALVLVPRGNQHSFWNSGAVDGHYLRFFSPAMSDEQQAQWEDVGSRVAAARERNEGTTHEIFFREVTRTRSEGMLR